MFISEASEPVESLLSFSKKEKFAVEIRRRDRDFSISQKRATALEHFDLAIHFKENDAIPLLLNLDAKIKENDLAGTLSLLHKIRILFRAKEINEEILYNQDILDVCCLFLESCSSDQINTQTIKCLEIITWITINLSARNNQETREMTRKGVVRNYLKIFLGSRDFMTPELIENILWTFMNILEDDVQEAFYEILENSLFLQKLLYQKELFVKRSILPQFLMRFTHNAFFYTVEHESSDLSNILELINLCIKNFPENLTVLTPDDEDFLKFCFITIKDCSNFLDELEFFLLMEENLELIVNSVNFLRLYFNMLRDVEPIFKFLLEFLDRIQGEESFLQLCDMTETFVLILQNAQKPFVIEKTIECVATLVITTDKEESKLFPTFSELIMKHFRNDNLKIKHQCVSFFYSLLVKLTSSVPQAESLLEYFNRDHLYQEVIGLVDNSRSETIMLILRFLKAFLEMGEFLKDEKGLDENICTIRIWVKEFCLTRIENLTFHRDDMIVALSTEVYDEFLNDNEERNI